MSDGLDYKDALRGLLRGGDAILAAAGAHPGITDPDSNFSLTNLISDKSKGGKSLGESATGSDAREQVVADLRDKEGRPKGSRSMNEILSGKGDKPAKKKGKGALAKAAISALGSGSLTPIEYAQYMPTSVPVSVVPYTGGRPTKTQQEYAKDLA